MKLNWLEIEVGGDKIGRMMISLEEDTVVTMEEVIPQAIYATTNGKDLQPWLLHWLRW